MPWPRSPANEPVRLTYFGRLAIASTAAAEARKDSASSVNAAPMPEGLDEHAADRRADEAQRDRADEVVEGVGLRELVGRQHLGRDRVEGGAEERAARAVERHEHDHVPQLEQPRDREERHDADRRAAREVGVEHEPAPVEPVAQHAAEQQERDRRDRHRDPHHRERRRRVGQRVDLPRHRDHEDAVADERDAHPAPEQAEVAVAQRREEPHPAQPARPVRPLVGAMQHRRRAPCRRRGLRRKSAVASTVIGLAK